jgi:hypothetical protein
MAEMTIDKEWLQETHYLGLQFQDGWYFVRVTGREPSNLRHLIAYNTSTSPVVNPTPAATSTVNWDTVQVSATDTRYQLAPGDDHRGEIYQLFYGIYPSNVRAYFQLVSRQQRNNLVRQLEPGDDFGYITGEDSPYFDPAIKTEFFTVNQVFPAFKIYNPATLPQTVYVNFQIMKYTYDVIKDPAMIKEFLEGKRRVKLYSMGLDTDQMVTVPQWWADYFKGVPKNLSEVR